MSHGWIFHRHWVHRPLARWEFPSVVAGIAQRPLGLALSAVLHLGGAGGPRGEGAGVGARRPSLQGRREGALEGTLQPQFCHPEGTARQRIRLRGIRSGVQRGGGLQVQKGVRCGMRRRRKREGHRMRKRGGQGATVGVRSHVDCAEKERIRGIASG